MDKALAKRTARDAGIRTTEYVLYRELPLVPPPFGFPSFVKPNRDGSSRGIAKDSLVGDMDSLVKRVGTIINDYHQPALVEPYLGGRDFCVGLLGNMPPFILPTCEILLGHEDGIPFFSFEYKRCDTDRLDFEPALPADVHRDMEDMARVVWEVIECRDYARFDFRTDSNGEPYFMEVNALPGLSPVSGIFVRQAAAAGISFDALIKKIMERILQ
jgi:D-alanine-D-alanine ligase